MFWAIILILNYHGNHRKNNHKHFGDYQNAFLFGSFSIVYLSHANFLCYTGDWRYRHAALMAISACGEGCHAQMEQMLGNVVEAVLPYVKDEVRFELLLTILHLHMSHCCSEGMIDTVKIELRQPAQVFIWVTNDVTQKPLTNAVTVCSIPAPDAFLAGWF